MKGFGFSIILLTCFLLIGNVSAVLGYTCGVRSGDYMRYNVSILGPVRSDSIKGSIKLTIQSVGCPHVSGTYEASVQGYSVTPQPEPFSLDISTGIGGYGGYIIPANLTFGSTIPGEGTTVQSIVDWGGRKAIQANATSPFSGLEGQIYWDQLTGVLLEAKSSSARFYLFDSVSRDQHVEWCILGLVDSYCHCSRGRGYFDCHSFDATSEEDPVKSTFYPSPSSATTAPTNCGYNGMPSVRQTVVHWTASERVSLRLQGVGMNLLLLSFVCRGQNGSFAM